MISINELRNKLASMGNNKKAEKSKSYLKSAYEFYGIGVPELRKITREYKNLEFNSALGLFDELWNSGNHEEMSLALFILGNYVKKHPNEIWKCIVERLGKAQSWDHIDELSSHILGKILAGNISLMPEIKKMAESRNHWIRRTSIVSTYPLIKKGKLELAFLLAEKLVYDEDIYVQKASGWMLREAGKRNRLAARDFIMLHIDMKPVAFSYATETSEMKFLRVLRKQKFSDKMKELRKIRKEKEKQE